MTDILRELYFSTFYDDRNPSEKLQDLQDRQLALLDKIIPLIGLDTLNALNNIQNAAEDELNIEWFHRGFRLGASLMLELR